MRNLGDVSIDPPYTGEWSYQGAPDTVIVLGRGFRRAGWRASYRGVVDQYREMVPLDSAHLMVLDDGSWRIDHVDQYNPDAGRPIQHFLCDHPIGKGLGLCTIAAGLLALAVGLCRWGSR